MQLSFSKLLVSWWARYTFFLPLGKGVEGSIFLDLGVPTMFPMMFPTSSQVPNVSI